MQVGYDVMDVDAPSFQADFNTFKNVIKELEKRLSALIVQVRCAHMWLVAVLHGPGGDRLDGLFSCRMLPHTS